MNNNNINNINSETLFEIKITIQIHNNHRKTNSGKINIDHKPLFSSYIIWVGLPKRTNFFLQHTFKDITLGHKTDLERYIYF